MQFFPACPQRSEKWPVSMGMYWNLEFQLIAQMPLANIRLLLSGRSEKMLMTLVLCSMLDSKKRPLTSVIIAALDCAALTKPMHGMFVDAIRIAMLSVRDPRLSVRWGQPKNTLVTVSWRPRLLIFLFSREDLPRRRLSLEFSHIS